MLDHIFIFSYLVTGGDLSYHLEKQGKFAISRVRLYMAEVSLALEYLRSKSIIHRDIKPANMLLDSQGHVHVTDFNVATIVRPNVPVLSTTGTRPYMGMQSSNLCALVALAVSVFFTMVGSHKI